MSLAQQLVKDDLIKTVNVSFLIIVHQVNQIVFTFDRFDLHVESLLDKLVIKDL